VQETLWQKTGSNPQARLSARSSVWFVSIQILVDLAAGQGVARGAVLRPAIIALSRFGLGSPMNTRRSVNNDWDSPSLKCVRM
jgi:hypothetical protein